MAVTDYKFPTTDGAKYDTWANPTNLFADDAAYSTMAINGEIKYQSLEAFAFGIPAGATIDGIQVELEGYLTDPGGSARDISVALYNNGSAGWSDVNYVSPACDTSLRVWTIGDSTTKWGKSWVVSDFSDANFSARIGSYFTLEAGEVYNVDYVKVRVYYTPPPATFIPRIRIF